MVDTGSLCSIWPLRLASNKPKKSCISLHAVNLSTIETYGQVSLTLNLGLRRNFRWIFIIADLPNPILGADFLDHFNLLVDVRRQKLVDNFSSLSTPARSTTTALFSPKFFIASAGNQFHSLLSSYPDLVDPSFNSAKVVYSTVHHITTTGPPVFSRPSRLAPDRLRKAKAEFDHMLQLGLICPSKSPWASPLHLVWKSEADFRPVWDYRRLNSVTVLDRYSIPNIQNFSANLHGSTLFSKIDLIRHITKYLWTQLISRKLQ